LPEKEFLGRGIKFPVKLNPMTGTIETSSYEEDIREAITIILMTNKGERIMRPEFGCNINKYLFAVMDYTNIQLMKKDIKDALIMWEPRIQNIEVSINKNLAENGKFMIEISYKVRLTNSTYNLVFPYFVNEGIANSDE